MMIISFPYPPVVVKAMTASGCLQLQIGLRLTGLSRTFKTCHSWSFRILRCLFEIKQKVISIIIIIMDLLLELLLELLLKLLLLLLLQCVLLMSL